MPTHIRLATPADAAQVREIYAPFCEDSPVSFEIGPPSVAEMASRIGTVTQTYPWLVCQRANEILGYAYACQHRERAAYRWAVDVSILRCSRLARKGDWKSAPWAPRLFPSLRRSGAAESGQCRLAGIVRLSAGRRLP